MIILSKEQVIKLHASVILAYFITTYREEGGKYW